MTVFLSSLFYYMFVFTIMICSLRGISANMRKLHVLSMRGGMANKRFQSSSAVLNTASSSSKRKYGVKVVTDIDDTVVSSGGLNIFGIALGGIDKQYKRKQFYPGVVQFALELSTNP